MRRYKTDDGYFVYGINNKNKKLFLGDRKKYGENIKALKEELEGIRYDSVIILFGLDTGEYLKELQDLLCEKNRVIIIEPNKEIFIKKKHISNEKIKIVLFDESKIRVQLASLINNLNFNNLYVHGFGNYKEIYKRQYNEMIKVIDSLYYRCEGAISLGIRFKECFVRNLVWNLYNINKSTSIRKYEKINEGVPAFIVSAGPSLSKNLDVLNENRECLKGALLIVGSRTLKSVLDKGMQPDLVVTLDPIDDNYEMIKGSLNCKAPLVFYEYSNKKIVSEYMGNKVYFSNLLSKLNIGTEKVSDLFLGGSVAHTCVDVARLIGCNTIILLGQDLAFTDNLHHAKEATFEIDKKVNHIASINVKSVSGEILKTNTTLLHFKNEFEKYIDENRRINFINSSYGADIKGAKFIELKDVVKMDIFNNIKKSLEGEEEEILDVKYEIENLLRFINYYIEKGNQIISYCTELMKLDKEKRIVDMNENDEEYIKFISILDTINSFERSRERLYIAGYFTEFDFRVKQEKFNMLAEMYDELTSNLVYQSGCFKYYFELFTEMLKAIENIVVEEVTKMEEYHSIKI